MLEPCDLNERDLEYTLKAVLVQLDAYARLNKELLDKLNQKDIEVSEAAKTMKKHLFRLFNISDNLARIAHHWNNEYRKQKRCKVKPEADKVIDELLEDARNHAQSHLVNSLILAN